MCGRFTLTRVDYDDLARSLGVEPVAEQRASYKPRYNVAPTDVCLILRRPEPSAPRELDPARWGLVNFWAKDAKRAAQQINARVEGVETSRAYKEAFAKRRCAVPADGYYEWTGPAKAKKPTWFHRADSGLILLAGLWEDWKNPATGEKQRTFTVLTSDSRGRVRNVHDRMPVLLPDALVEDWLVGDAATAHDTLAAALTVDPDPFLIGTEVSSRVNSVRNDDPGCLGPPESPKGQQSLF